MQISARKLIHRYIIYNRWMEIPCSLSFLGIYSGPLCRLQWTQFHTASEYFPSEIFKIRFIYKFWKSVSVSLLCLGFLLDFVYILYFSSLSVFSLSLFYFTLCVFLTLSVPVYAFVSFSDYIIWFCTVRNIFLCIYLLVSFLVSTLPTLMLLYSLICKMLLYISLNTLTSSVFLLVKWISFNCLGKLQKSYF